MQNKSLLNKQEQKEKKRKEKLTFPEGRQKYKNPRLWKRNISLHQELEKIKIFLCFSLSLLLPQFRRMRTLETNTSGSVSEFILAFPCLRDIQFLLYVLFSIIYFLILMGKAAIICAVWSSWKLYTPMYILLANFSFLEMCYFSSNVPKMLANLISQTTSISYAGCLLQFYFFFFMCVAESLFLSVMSFDRFLAICLFFYFLPFVDLCIILSL